MRRLLLISVLGLALPAGAFTLLTLSLAPATPLVWFEAQGPTATTAVLSGYNSLTAAATNLAVEQRMYQRIKPLRLAYTVTAAGTGAGTFTYEAFDNTSSTSLCASTPTACTTGTGSSSLDCIAGGTNSTNAGDDVRLRINASGCSTSPTGTVSLEYSQVLLDEGVDFVPRFIPYGLWGLDGGGNFFGLDAFQFDTVTCGWSTAGVVSGGTDIMRVQLIQKSDAGVLCTCDLPGACSDAALSEHTCTCSGGTKYLTGTAALSAGYAIQLNSATNCGYNPQGLVCAIPFHK